MLLAAACSRDGASASGPRLQDVVENGPVVPVVRSADAVPGQAVAVLFRNTVDQEFWFNPCERFTERLVDGAWIRLADELRLCNSMAYVLRASGEREEQVDVPNDLSPGTYRFVFVMRPPRSGDVSHRPASTTFRVPAAR